MADLRVALKGETSIGYIIAPPNATEEDKKKADLVLDDMNGSPHTQLADMVDMLHDRRGQNTDIAIVLEFCPGVIELPNETNWEIPEEQGNIYIYGNGVKINGNCEDEYLFSVVDCWLFDLEVKTSGANSRGILATDSTLTNCSGSGGSSQGIHAENSTLTNCSGSSGSTGISAKNSTLTNCSGSGDFSSGILANNSTLTNCSGSGKYNQGITASNSALTNCSGSGRSYGIYAENSTFLTNCSGSSNGEYDSGIHASNSTLSNCDGVSTGDGISASNSTLTNCSGSGNDGYGIYAYGSCVIQGCDGTEGGISVPEEFVGMYPNTLALLQAFNKGSIIERD